MNSDSVGNRLKDIQINKRDNVENVKETMGKIPKILSPKIHDVFHVSVSMLDLKSFVKLAVTSKEMYKRCMENKSIRISVNLEFLDAARLQNPVVFTLYGFDVPRRIPDSHIAAFRKFPCKINFRSLRTFDYVEQRTAMLPDIHRFMKEIGVNKIHELHLRSSVRDWETFFAILKDFDINSVNIDFDLDNDELLRSLLQLNLEKFFYGGPVSFDFILEIDSPIREISFTEYKRLSIEELLDITSKIQSGSLRHLTVDPGVIKWNSFNMLPFDHEGDLPDDRPLLIARTPKYSKVHDYWLLHWHGGVTKCFCPDFYVLKISKCEPWELPYILRKEEDVLKDLAEKHPRISCSANHFRTFSMSFTPIDPSQEESLPENRPLCFIISENSFWLLDKDETLMKCTWEDGCATWEPSFSLRNSDGISHPLLAKYVFWKVAKQIVGDYPFHLHCREPAGFLKGFRTLDFKYSGVLPNKRPLIFEKRTTYSDIRLVLLEERLLHCKFTPNSVSIRLCHYMDSPPILFTAKNVMEMLKYNGDMHFNISFEIFRDSLELFKNSVLVLQKRLVISEKTETEFWYRIDEHIRKATWEKGRLSISEVDDIRECPPHLRK